MAQTQNQLQAQLVELKDYYANILMLMEQTLSLDPRSQAATLAEINSRIQNLMMAATQKSAVFQRGVREYEDASQLLNADLRREINEFGEALPAVLRPLIERIGASISALAEEREKIKAELLRIQQSHQGLGGYKQELQKHPKYLDSTI